jgi:citrate synthase
VRDPRAAVLERATQRLERAGVATGRLELARAVERAAEGALREKHPDRPLRANVEFYTAVLLDTLGLDRREFSPTFAVGRVAGWAAHVAEQRATGRLIRPASTYVGPAPEPI